MGYKVICVISVIGINDIDVVDFTKIYADVAGYATDGVTEARVYFGPIRAAVPFPDMVNGRVLRDALVDRAVSYLNEGYSLGITARDVYVQ